MLALLALAACGGGYSGNYGGGGGGGNGIVTNIVIAPGTSALTPGMTQQFMATSKDSGGNVVNGAVLTWASSNTAVATVNSNGLVTAKADGSSSITASITYSGGGGMYGGPPVTYTSNMATVSVTGSDMVMGTAAVGHALAEAVVTLKDAHGQTQTAMSDAEGHFQLSTAGLQAPFLLKVVDNQGRTLFGMRADAGVANVTPVTDLMARAWFTAHGGDTEAAFADPAHHPAPDAASLAQLDGRFTQALKDDVAAQGLDPQTFSFISTPFNADGTGADRILDNLGVDTDRGRLMLQDRMGGRQIDASMLMREGTDSKQSSI